MSYNYKYSSENRLDASFSSTGAILVFAILVIGVRFLLQEEPPSTEVLLTYVYGSILLTAASITFLFLIFSIGSFILSVYIDENGIAGPNLYGAQKWIIWEEMEECSFETILGVPHLVFISSDRTEIRVTVLIDDFDDFIRKVVELSTSKNLNFSSLFLTVIDDLL